ncbi:PREDICTED: uncharacterized protein LOC105569816 [Vollenhovia emeryi]|uniref:uncharacterized protein LOC105569816 n=1 Tax=Vollenhovia emeryi TaxID=411798 RepID=UPI0005F544FB|nr:PREDICTED: uncharacterized protein LOC105569816 [Vollenhovia emeryi]
MPSFRHYNLMIFLNDTLEHRQTVTSLKLTPDDQQASTSTANIDDLYDVRSSVNNDTLESRSLSPSSDSTPISVTSKKRKKSICLDKYEEALVEALKKTKEPSPIDGFVLRLAEGLQRLSYKQRLKLEIEILTKLYEIEESGEV